MEIIILYSKKKTPFLTGFDPQANREEKSLRHVAMVAKFLDDQPRP